MEVTCSNTKFILENAGQQQFRKKPNTTKDQRINLQCLKTERKSVGLEFRQRGSVWKVRLSKNLEGMLQNLNFICDKKLMGVLSMKVTRPKLYV